MLLMSILKKFTPEFKDYLKNVYLCSTNLFLNYSYKTWTDSNKEKLKKLSEYLSPNFTHKLIESWHIKIVSFNVMKFINKKDIFECFDDYINNWTDFFLIQEAIILDWVNIAWEYFKEKWFYTYFQPISINNKKTKVNNFDVIWLMIASKHPINKTDNLFYDITRPNNWLYDMEILFWVLYWEISVWDKILWLYCVHWEWFSRPSWRKHQINQFIKWSNSHNNNITVLWWDFNTWLPFFVEKWLHEVEKNNFKYFRNKKPILSLDHIWIRWTDDYEDIKILSKWSDHTAIACKVNIWS